MDNDSLPSSIRLLDLIKSTSLRPSPKSYEQAENLRYAMYVRKSTESEERQAQSIESQIKDCLDLVIQPNGIKFNPRTDIFREERSAKEAGTRKVFRQMLDLIIDGEYNGIIAWHHDRLARNMKEAGEIIDMVDRGVIKDLQFAKANFDNSPNGKMILGINFVLSKHYSDHLSESVLRGNKSSTQKGRVLRHMVHGYRITDGERKLVPDDTNYLLIEKAFRMRIDEKRSLSDIVKYLNSAGYQQYRLSSGHNSYKFTQDKLSKVFKTPIYAGVYAYGEDVVQMTEIDPDFTPMISEQEFIGLNGSGSLLPYSSRHRARRDSGHNVSNFLRNFVICSHCNTTMGTSVTVKYSSKWPKNKPKNPEYGDHIFRFMCKNRACEMKGSGPPGTIVRDYAVDFLKKHQFTTEAAYKAYLKDSDRFITEARKELRSQRKSLEVKRTQSKNAYENALNVASLTDNSGLSRHYDSKYLDKLKLELESVQSDIDKVDGNVALLEHGVADFDEFLELYKNIGDLLRLTSSMELADEIVRIFFSNFIVTGVPYGKKLKQKQWSVTGHCLNEPFDKLVENGEFLVWSG